MTEIETLTEEERDWLQRFRHCPWPDVSRSAADAGVDAGAALRKLLRLHDALQARVKELEDKLQREQCLEIEQTAKLKRAETKCEQLEKRAALYDQECGMCGSTAEELVEYAEWCNARAERRARQEHGDES